VVVERNLTPVFLAAEMKRENPLVTWLLLLKTITRKKERKKKAPNPDFSGNQSYFLTLRFKKKKIPTGHFYEHGV
jgi:hypothetical protein